MVKNCWDEETRKKYKENTERISDRGGQQGGIIEEKWDKKE